MKAKKKKKKTKRQRRMMLWNQVKNNQWKRKVKKKNVREGGIFYLLFCFHINCVIKTSKTLLSGKVNI